MATKMLRFESCKLLFGRKSRKNAAISSFQLGTAELKGYDNGNNLTFISEIKCHIFSFQINYSTVSVLHPSNEIIGLQAEETEK